MGQNVSAEPLFEFVVEEWVPTVAPNFFGPPTGLGLAHVPGTGSRKGRVLILTKL